MLEYFYLQGTAYLIVILRQIIASAGPSQLIGLHSLRFLYPDCSQHMLEFPGLLTRSNSKS
jgi:hypothetical protein